MAQGFFAWLTRIGDLLLGWIPRGWDLVPLLLISVLAGLVVLYIYRGISSPSQIKRSKDQVKAHILAIRLYKDEWRVIVRSFFFSLVSTARYFAFNMIPLLILLPLLAPLFAQLEARYGLSAVDPGQVVEVKCTFNEGLEALDPVLIQEDWFKPAMSPVFVYALNEAHWQIEITQPGHHVLRIQTSQGTADKSLRSGEEVPRWALSPRRHQGGLLDGLLYPVEKALPADGVFEAIAVHYPGRTFHLAGYHVHWIWVHLLVVLLVVLILKKRFGIEF